MNENRNFICFVMICTACVIMAMVIMDQGSYVRELKIELKRCQLDKAGLNGLAKALIDQKFNIPSNAFEYRPSLPDCQSIIVKVYYDEESPLNDYQIALIKQRHSIAIGEIGIDEWNKFKEMK